MLPGSPLPTPVSVSVSPISYLHCIVFGLPVVQNCIQLGFWSFGLCKPEVIGSGGPLELFASFLSELIVNRYIAESLTTDCRTF